MLSMGGTFIWVAKTCVLVLLKYRILICFVGLQQGNVENHYEMELVNCCYYLREFVLLNVKKITSKKVISFYNEIQRKSFKPLNGLFSIEQTVVQLGCNQSRL
jgi:hypothetical protein